MESQYATVRVMQEVRKYKPFEGPNTREMPKLRAEGRELITPREVFQVRLDGMKGDRKFLRNNWVSTNVAVIPNPDGKEIKLVHKHPLIYTINPNTKLTEEGAMPVTHEHYAQKEGLILTGSDVQEFQNIDAYALPKKREEVWEFLAEGDVGLAKAYKKDVCKTLGLDFDSVMGLYFTQTKGLRLWVVGRLSNRGRGYGSYLGRLGGRLVGVAPIAQFAKKSGLEVKISEN